MRITNEDNIKEWSKQKGFVVQKFTDEGDFYRQHIINRTLFSLLGDVKDKTILDAGCGEGYLSRMLAKKGAKVTRPEPSDLIDHAIQREKKENLGITYVKEDLSKWKGTSDSFDIVVSNMVFMDIPDYQSAIENCIEVLKPGGVFVFSITHPCFDEKGSWQHKPFVEVKDYFEEYQIQNYIGLSFHRMLSTYMNFFIEHGCKIERLLEPGLPEGVKPQHERDTNVPNFLFIRAVKTI